MLDVFIRAALFLLQNQVTNTSGTSSNRVRCDQTTEANLGRIALHTFACASWERSDFTISRQFHGA